MSRTLLPTLCVIAGPNGSGKTYFNFDVQKKDYNDLLDEDNRLSVRFAAE